MFRPVTADRVPLVTLDDATLLQAEKDTRKTVAQAKSRIIGGGVNLLLLSPMAVFSIAKSHKVSKREYWSHEDLMKEIERRKLTVLPKTFDESNAALLGGQVAAIALGHTVGGMVGDAVGTSVSAVSTYIASEATDHAVQEATITASGKVTDTIGGNSIPNPQSAYSLPDTSSTATNHLSGTWSGFGQSEVESNTPEPPPYKPDESPKQENIRPAGFKGLVVSAVSIAATHLSSTTNAIKTAAASSTPLRTLVSGLSNSVVTTASAVVTVVTAGKPGSTEVIKEDFAVPIKYRMKFEFGLTGVDVSGKNLVDGLAVTGKCHESGTVIHWSEYDKESDLTVSYQAKVSGGQMNGTWNATDGRKGTFALSHL
ncbi:hypothetical protein BDR26DRAFT_854011 [Obelidium mucronatum]|nr:hypothetical protein BDR26DRAFT_854011 [Obelidium mucronatum]